MIKADDFRDRLDALLAGRPRASETPHCVDSYECLVEDLLGEVGALRRSRKAWTVTAKSNWRQAEIYGRALMSAEKELQSLRQEAATVSRLLPWRKPAA